MNRVGDREIRGSGILANRQTKGDRELKRQRPKPGDTQGVFEGNVIASIQEKKYVEEEKGAQRNRHQ